MMLAAWRLVAAVVASFLAVIAFEVACAEPSILSASWKLEVPGPSHPATEDHAPTDVAKVGPKDVERWPPPRKRKRDTTGPGYLRLPVSRHVVNTTGWPNETHPSLARRWGWSQLDDYMGIAYLIDLQIGTPAQTVKVFVDTGSYELWVNPTCSKSPNQTLCNSFGYYNPRTSSTVKNVNQDFQLYYGSGYAQGRYYTDQVYLAMNTVPEVQFGVANRTDYVWAGILGLGYGYPWDTTYDSVLDNIWLYGFIDAPIFSIGLGGVGDGFSEIIFGGVNVFKFTGQLEPLLITPPPKLQPQGGVQYWVNVTSVGMTRPDSPPVIYTDHDHFTMRMLIDTGSTLSYMRADLVAIVAQQFGATIDQQRNIYFVDCSYRLQNGTVDWGFNRGRVVVQVRYRDFIQEISEGVCQLGVQPADRGAGYVLGDTFIRAAYLVFDQTSDTVWMAPYYNCGDGVKLVGREKGDVAQAVGRC